MSHLHLVEFEDVLYRRMSTRDHLYVEIKYNIFVPLLQLIGIEVVPSGFHFHLVTSDVCMLFFFSRLMHSYSLLFVLVTRFPIMHEIMILYKAALSAYRHVYTHVEWARSLKF